LSWVLRTQHLLMNEVELLSLFEMSDIERAMEAAAQVMPKGSAVIAKRGPLGASGLQDGRMVHVPAPSVAAGDPIGARHVFNAGYLDAAARGESLQNAVAAGVATASRAISTHPREYVAPAARQIGAGR